jgi:hypothetical protein
VSRSAAFLCVASLTLLAAGCGDSVPPTSSSATSKAKETDAGTSAEADAARGADPDKTGGDPDAGVKRTRVDTGFVAPSAGSFAGAIRAGGGIELGVGADGRVSRLRISLPAVCGRRVVLAPKQPLALEGTHFTYVGPHDAVVEGLFTEADRAQGAISFPARSGCRARTISFSAVKGS